MKVGIQCPVADATANPFPGNKHGSLGWVVLFFATMLTVIDICAGIRRCIAYLRSGDKFNLKTFWQTVFLNKRMTLDGIDAEYARLVQEPEEYEVGPRLCHRP